MIATPTRSRTGPAESTPRTAWVAALDRLGLPLLVLGRDGSELWRSAAFKAILAREPLPARKHILNNARQAACWQLAQFEPCASGGSIYRLVPGECAVTEIRLSGACHYIMRTTCIDGAESFKTPIVVIAALEQRMVQLPSVQRLCSRFGLTHREAQVALLLAQRCQNAEIADRLCVSLHTARHHTERVLDKLCVHRRTRVMQVFQDMHIALCAVIMLCLVGIQNVVFAMANAGVAVQARYIGSLPRYSIPAVSCARPDQASRPRIPLPRRDTSAGTASPGAACRQ